MGRQFAWSYIHKSTTNHSCDSTQCILGGPLLSGSVDLGFCVLNIFRYLARIFLQSLFHILLFFLWCSFVVMVPLYAVSLFTMHVMNYTVQVAVVVGIT